MISKWVDGLKEEVRLIEWPKWPDVWQNVLSVVLLSFVIGFLVWVCDILVTGAILTVGKWV
ncbi:preprotein translocase subunit SecE [bacterium]|nr:preprotein translocase subunit SecE [bacterium]